MKIFKNTYYRGLNFFGLIITNLFIVSNLLAFNPCADYIEAVPNTVVTVDVIVNQSIIGSENDIANITYVVYNLSSDPITDVQLSPKASLYYGGSSLDMPNAHFSGDPNNNGQLDPNEIWFYTVAKSFTYSQGDIFILSAGVQGNSACGHEVGGGAGMLFTSGVNMDVGIEQECVEPGETIDVTLTTRLLIDEDAAKNPGVTIIIVGGTEIIIPLPASQWEARDLIISVTDLNGGIEFDPFNPPPGIGLTNFCEQGGADAGRNTGNVLDECEPIETVRAPCTDPGEDDVLCEFPDWVFCYSIEIPNDYDQESYTITATDNFSIWKADENPAGSGEYGDFVDVTDQVENGGSDAASVEVKNVIIPVELVHFEAKKKGSHSSLNWETASEINNSHFMIERSTDGSRFEEIGITPGNGTSTEFNAYNFVDHTPATGLNYYRLAQYDYDGSVHRSYVSIVDFSYAAGSGSIIVYPNPVYDRVKIETVTVQENIDVFIYNASGKAVKHQIVNSGEILNLADLPVGQYTIKVYDASRYEIGTEQITIIR